MALGFKDCLQYLICFQSHVSSAENWLFIVQANRSDNFLWLLEMSVELKLTTGNIRSVSLVSSLYCV